MSELRTIVVDGAPKAIGPYAQAIAAGGFLFTAGQVPLDPATMKLVSGTIAEETNRIFDNLAAILAGANCGMGDVVKTTVFLIDMASFAEMNGAYASRFGNHRPARSTIQVSALPAGARVEIEVVAKLPAA